MMPSRHAPSALLAALALALLAPACPSTEVPVLEPIPMNWECFLDAGEEPDFTPAIGCQDDFFAVASRPLDTSIPGARTAKTVIDQADDNRLYFQNSNRYAIHYEFCAEHLNGEGLPPVGDISLFNQIEYYSPSRRFLLGAITFYEEPGVWAYEIAPYDTSSAEMVATAYQALRSHAYFGEDLYFHPTSSNVEQMAVELPDWVKVITTDELFADITYQPLNLGESYGQLRFVAAEDLGDVYVSPRDVVVLDGVPNDISVIAGLITAEFQTPLSHVNVLSQNRGTPNMALRGAFEDETLRALDLAWVRLEVEAFSYELEEVSEAEADAWWEEHKPDDVHVPDLDLTVTDLRDIEEITLDDISAFGGKASHYGVMSQIDQDLVPSPKAFAVPVYYYKQFEEENAFDVWVAELLSDEDFINDPAVRDTSLAELREAIEVAPVDPDFEAALTAKLEADYPHTRMRFRSSTNAEDLPGFTGAGLYSSHSGDPDDPSRPVMDAVRKTWASLWNFRAFEERSYNGIPHDGVAMALLVHHSFPDEEANGVALTANMFDETQPGFYVNVQAGEAS
ncbi:MAG: PEP/pyruvate-binding domain-containing protein, partial [Myxococcota bacterium]|nr:PEP/pyruvate-binding domain-containing protein [Myxococcota bacterium]